MFRLEKFILLNLLTFAAFLAISGTAHATLINRAIIDFNEAVAARFSLDNLSIDTTTLTFTEVAFQPVNGLTVNGITFGFTVGGFPSIDANYNSGGPGSIIFVQDPSLEGNAFGILQLDFLIPTSTLSFGMALSSGFTGIGATVQLFDTTFTPFGGLQPLNVSPLVSFSEGQFSAAMRVPEPAALALFCFGLLGLGLARRRRRAK